MASPRPSSVSIGSARISLSDGYLVTHDRMSFETRQSSLSETHGGSRLGYLRAEDNDLFQLRFRARLDTLGIEQPKVEVRFKNLGVSVGISNTGRSVPSLPNYFISLLQSPLYFLGLSVSEMKVNILNDITGIVRPRRITLLLGPPSSGKTTLLRALAGLSQKGVNTVGEITYNGHQMDEFFPRKTSSYINQYDRQTAELTVSETLDFYNQIQGAGSRFDLLNELKRREKEEGIKPDENVSLFLKDGAGVGSDSTFLTDYFVKLLGLELCANTLIGDDMRRGVSGGQKKRVTIGEMLVGPAKAFFMDEITNGLDSSTSYRIIKHLRQIAHMMDTAMLISLVQPAPETFELFNDIILLSEGKIVYQGPREHALDFFASMGLKCPERKAVADFLQEVTSRKDQEQYWSDKSQPFRYIEVDEFVTAFKKFHVGIGLASEMAVPYDKLKCHPSALAHQKYSLSTLEILRTTYAREKKLTSRNGPTYKAKIIQMAITGIVSSTLFIRTKMHHDSISDGNKFMANLFFSLLFVMTAGFAEIMFTATRLPVFYKERELSLYPAWSVTLPMFIMRLPWSIVEAATYVIITYFITGYEADASRFFRYFLCLLLLNQSAVGMFRTAGALGRGSKPQAYSFGAASLLATVVLGGFVVSRDRLRPWLRWVTWLSPVMYAQNAASVNMFLGNDWNKAYGPNTTLGIQVLKAHGLETRGYWVWLGMGVVALSIIFFNITFTLALHFLEPHKMERNTLATANDKDVKNSSWKQPWKRTSIPQSLSHSVSDMKQKDIGEQQLANMENASAENLAVPAGEATILVDIQNNRRAVLPFQPLFLSFDDINYSVDMPQNMKDQGILEERLQLLDHVSGVFSPGVLTALVGESGAGKTTLLDVLAGRKTRGYIEGYMKVSGYPKEQATFARVTGYCEQTDIHSPYVTVYEALVFSAWLRLPLELDDQTRRIFVEEVMDLVELQQSRSALVGIPGQSGLSTEQRKRLTIAVELVANPSMIFLDEPTTGLDARAAAIVMRAVRNIGDTGRTIVCTIHQPSIDIFEAFDELLLLKRGGQVIYAGSLGKNSNILVKYFEAIPGVPKLKEGQNPAGWMLDATSSSVEATLGVDFGQIYRDSTFYVNMKSRIKELSVPCKGSSALSFPTVYAQPFSNQFKTCLWKMHRSYWHNTSYTGTRFLFLGTMAIVIGVIFWDLGKKRDTEQDLYNLMGAMYSSTLFPGAFISLTVQPTILIERVVYYRERGAGMYSPLAYAVSQFLIEVPHVLLQSTVFVCLIYSMINFEWTVAKFMYYWLMTYFGMLFFTYWGMMSVAATPDGQRAAILSTGFLGFFNLFSGFIISRKKMPVFWRWFYWCTPPAWNIYGLFTSQLGDVQSSIHLADDLGAPVTVKEYLRRNFGYRHDFLKWVAVEQILLVASLALLFAILIKSLNYQKR